MIGKSKRGACPDIAIKHMKPTDGKDSLSLADQIAEWRKERDALLPHGVDLFETPSYADAAILEWEKSTTLRFEPLDTEEQRWVANATRGGLTFGKPVTGDMLSLDVNSHYPNLMQSSTSRFPLTAGTFKTLDADFLIAINMKSVGIYRVDISTVPVPTVPRLYLRAPKSKKGVEKEKGFYTQYDIMLMKQRGITPKLVDDGMPNALVWWGKDDSVSGGMLFGAFVNKWYGLKLRNVPGAKKVLTSLWGKLGEKADKKRTRTLTVLKEEKADDGIGIFGEGTIEDVEDDEIVTAVEPAGNGTINVSQRRPEEIFSGKGPQVGPFVTALGRKTLASHMTAHGLEHIKRVHTDGFFTTLPFEQWPETTKGKIGTGLGDLKIDKKVSSVRHCNSYVAESIAQVSEPGVDEFL